MEEIPVNCHFIDVYVGPPCAFRERILVVVFCIVMSVCPKVTVPELMNRFRLNLVRQT
jgi:hypothetical protein